MVSFAILMELLKRVLNLCSAEYFKPIKSNDEWVFTRGEYNDPRTYFKYSIYSLFRHKIYKINIYEFNC